MEEAVFHKVYKDTVTGKLNSVEAALLGKQLLVKKKKKALKNAKLHARNILGKSA